jgi:hypothetical protein
MIASFDSSRYFIDPKSTAGVPESGVLEGFSFESFKVYIHNGGVSEFNDHRLTFASASFCSDTDSYFGLSVAGIVERHGSIKIACGVGSLKLTGGYGIVVAIPADSTRTSNLPEENVSQFNDGDNSSVVPIKVMINRCKQLYISVLHMQSSVTQDLQTSNSEMLILINEGSGMFYLNDDTFFFSKGCLIRIRNRDKYQFQTLDDSSTMAIIEFNP